MEIAVARNPAPGQRHLPHHLARIAETGALHRPLHDPAPDAEGPAVDRPAKAEAQAVMRRQIVGRARRASPRQIVGTGDQRHAAMPQLLRPQPRVAQRPDADRDIGALLDQVDDHVRQRQVHPHAGIARAKTRQQRDQALDPEGGRGVDPQQPARLTPVLAQPRLQLHHVAQQHRHPVAIGRPLARQRQRPRRPAQQGDAQPLLQPRDRPAHRRRRQPQRLGRIGEAPLARHHQERLDVAQPVIHDFNSLLK